MSEQATVLYIGGRGRSVSTILTQTLGHIPGFVYVGGISLSVDHTVSGNPSRFRTGKIELRQDEEWKVKMRGADKNVVTALTAPLLLNCGYLGRRETSKWYRH